jgi:anaerobic selenocysteine-containing dehydrogenase
MVDPIGPIKMKSRTEWIVGDQAGPNFRGVSAALGVIPRRADGAESPAEGQGGRQSAGDPALKRGMTLDVEQLLTSGAAGVDVLYILDARFSERASDPAVVANLRKAKFLVVHSWDANHPLTEVADVLIPGSIHPEKEGTYTNLQGKDQQIHQAFPPKGQAVTDLEALRRVAARVARVGELAEVGA